MKDSIYFNIKIPRVALLGNVDVDEVPKKLAFEGNVASKITDFGAEYRELCKNRITAGELAVLLNAYLLGELGRPILDAESEQAKLLDYLFNQEEGKANVCSNAIDWNDSGELEPKEGYSRAAVFSDIDGFELDNGMWKPVINERTETIHLYLPESGYVGRTNDGAYHPSGFPFETWKTRKEAEQTWTDAGFSEDFARKAVSHFYSIEEEAGVFAVIHGYWSNGGGRFAINTFRVPNACNPHVGGLYVTRPAINE